jgi:hypothetical protein
LAQALFVEDGMGSIWQSVQNGQFLRSPWSELNAKRPPVALIDTEPPERLATILQETL